MVIGTQSEHTGKSKRDVGSLIQKNSRGHRKVYIVEYTLEVELIDRLV